MGAPIPVPVHAMSSSQIVPDPPPKLYLNVPSLLHPTCPRTRLVICLTNEQKSGARPGPSLG